MEKPFENLVFIIKEYSFERILIDINIMFSDPVHVL